MAKNTLPDQRRNRNKKKTVNTDKAKLSDLLLAQGLSDQVVDGLLRPHGFFDTKRADANLQGMAGEPRARRLLATLIDDILQAVSVTADPDQALNHWEQFLREGVNRVQLFEYLQQSPRMLQVLCTVFGNVPNLAQTLIRDPALVYWLAEENVLSRRPSQESLTRALQQMLGHLTTDETKLDVLRRFKRREMLRVGIRDLLRFAPVEETISVLSDLAAVLLQAAYSIVSLSLQRQYGKPIHHCPDRGFVETGCVVMAMGKLGGGELNFSSDVDLIYVYETDEGQTQGVVSSTSRVGCPEGVLSNEEYFEYVAREFTKAVGDITQEGYVFRVDLRLRAEGSVGKLARSIDDYKQYYFSRGQVWERMALLKAYPIAGKASVGESFLKAVRPFIIGSNGKEGQSQEWTHVLSEVKSIKAMIDEHMFQRKQEERNVKLGVGGIREIEFSIQTFQVLYGERIPGIIDRNSLAALSKLRREKIISVGDEKKLKECYLFLRDIEHKLQMVDDLQMHALPDGTDDLERSAIRMGYLKTSKGRGLKKFLLKYRDTTTFVHKFFLELVDDPEGSTLLQKATRRLKQKR